MTDPVTYPDDLRAAAVRLSAAALAFQATAQATVDTTRLVAQLQIMRTQIDLFRADLDAGVVPADAWYDFWKVTTAYDGVNTTFDVLGDRARHLLGRDREELRSSYDAVTSIMKAVK